MSVSSPPASARASSATHPARVLLVYSAQPPIMDYFAHALRRAGIETDFLYADRSTRFDKWVIHPVNKLLHNLRLLKKSEFAFADHRLAHKNFRSAELKRKIAAWQPDLVLLVRGLSFDHDALAAAPRLFGWWIEREERVDEALRELALFDWYFFMNRACVETAHANGHANASYMPHSVDPEAFRPLGERRHRYDLCFVGNWSPKRQEYLEAALRVTPNIALYGRGWRKHNLARPALWRCVKGRHIGGEALNRLYNASRIVLNVTNWGAGEGKARSGMNMRVIEVPATGAFLLTDESRELDEFLTPGEHLGTYADLADFPRQIARWLNDDETRERIAGAGREHVVQHFSYDRLVEQILGVYAQSAR